MKDNIYISDSTEDEFGCGNELSTTGFLIFGLLTFWMYTVHNYHNILTSHLKARSSYFDNSIRSVRLSPENQNAYTFLTQKGFRTENSPKYICFSLYFVSMTLIMFIFLLNIGGISHFHIRLSDTFILILVGIAALTFDISSVYFLSWVCRTIKNHEYYELLTTKLIRYPDMFKLFQPSDIFVKRWNNNQNKIALFLILSLPLIISPFIALIHFYNLIDVGEVTDKIALIWMAGIFMSAAIFHLWGTKLLIDMYNGHLGIEAVNRHGLSISMQSQSESSADGIDEISDDSTETKKLGRLTPERMLAAIMMTDMVGFSKEMETNEQDTYLKLLKHNEIIRKNILQNWGQEIKTIGDAFLVRFNSAVDAIKAATNIQTEFSEYNRDKRRDDQIRIRIGIHIGDILIMGKDVIGNGVNIAARIEPLAEPGGICISADTYNMIKKSIDIKVLSLGKKELKNITDSPEIYKILLESIH